LGHTAPKVTIYYSLIKANFKENSSKINKGVRKCKQVYQKFTAESDGELITKIGQHLKLRLSLQSDLF